MSFTAYVAFKNESGSFDIHYSKNGGDNYILKEILDDYRTGELDRSASGHPKNRKVDELTAHIAENEPWAEPIDQADDDMISPDPIAINLPRTKILNHIQPLETEVVYIVTDEQVETYIPISAYPHSIYEIQQAAEISLYKLKRGETPQEIQHNAGRQPDKTLTTLDFEPDEIYNHPDWVMKTIEQAHRYLAASINRMADESHEQTSTEEMIHLPRITANVEVTGTLPETDFTPLTIPIRVFFNRNNTPTYDMVQDSIEQMGTEPKSHTSKKRLLSHSDFVTDLDQNTDVDDVIKKHSYSITEGLLTKYRSAIDFSLISDKKLKPIHQRNQNDFNTV